MRTDLQECVTAEIDEPPYRRREEHRRTEIRHPVRVVEHAGAPGHRSPSSTSVPWSAPAESRRVAQGNRRAARPSADCATPRRPSPTGRIGRAAPAPQRGRSTPPDRPTAPSTDGCCLPRPRPDSAGRHELLCLGNGELRGSWPPGRSLAGAVGPGRRSAVRRRPG